MMTEKPKLVFLDGETTVKEVPLDPGEWTLGRSRSCTIQLEDTEVSSRHAVLRVTGTEVWLKDAGSKNGSHLNEKLLRGEVSLASGDLVRIGNTRIRFEAPAAADADFAVPPGPSPEAESAGAATRFMAVPEEHGTHMPEGEKLGATTGHDDGTVALQEGATRMLEASELKGLQASPKAARDIKKIVGGVVVSIAVLAGAFFLAKRTQGPNVELAVVLETIRDQEGIFEFSIPEHWSRSEKPDIGLVSFTFQDHGANAQVDVMTETNADYELTGLTMGFNQFLEESKSRYSEFKLHGQKKMELNDVTVVFYAFSGKDRQGKGIYLINGTRRLVMEGHSPYRDYPVFADLFSTILQSFKLDKPQSYFDLPTPDEAVRRISLASPDQALQKAKDHFLQGKELLRKRDVRLDNLYRAVREFQTSLQFAVTLSTRPSVYREAAEELKYALQLFNEKVRRQRFEMNWAYKQGDRQAAYWAVCELMQMIPEKTDPVYQEASAWMKQLTKTKKR
jgi:hypothetical protein